MKNTVDCYIMPFYKEVDMTDMASLNDSYYIKITYTVAITLC